MKKKTLALLSLVMLAVLLMTACSSTAKTNSKYNDKTTKLSADPVTLTIATKQGSSAGLSALKEAFEAAYPNVTVEIITTHDITQGFETDNVDIFMGSYEYETWYDHFAAIWEQSCVDFNTADLVDLTGFDSNLLGSLTVDGKLYSLPLTTGSVGLVTNMDLLKACGITKAPETVDELLAACAAVKAKGYQPFRCMPISLAFMIEGMTEYEICKDGKNEAFVQAALTADPSVGSYFATAADFLVACEANGYLDSDSLVYIPEAESKGGNEQPIATYMQECYAFLNGDVAFYPNASDILSSLHKRETRLEKYASAPFDYDFIPTPTKYGAAPIRMGAYCLFLNKNSGVVDWSKKFIQFCFWREDTTTVGNTAIFADAQYTMSPYDTDKVFTKTSQAYYSQFHTLFANSSSCIANDVPLLEYNGKGIYAGCVKYGFDLSKGEACVDILSAAGISSEAVQQKFVDACKSWFIDGNLY